MKNNELIVSCFYWFLVRCKQIRREKYIVKENHQNLYPWPTTKELTEEEEIEFKRWLIKWKMMTTSWTFIIISLSTFTLQKFVRLSGVEAKKTLATVPSTTLRMTARDFNKTPVQKKWNIHQIHNVEEVSAFASGISSWYNYCQTIIVKRCKNLWWCQTFFRPSLEMLRSLLMKGMMWLLSAL